MGWQLGMIIQHQVMNGKSVLLSSLDRLTAECATNGVQIHNKIQFYKTYYGKFLLLKFYHSEFKIHNVSQEQGNQLV